MNNPDKKIQPFHLAIPVSNLEDSKHFYHDLLVNKIENVKNGWDDDANLIEDPNMPPSFKSNCDPG